MSQEPHIYQRTVTKEERSSLSVLAGMVKPKSLVLDLGCGSGALGTYLHDNLECTVDGATISNEEAKLARASYRNVVVADLDQLDVQQAFAGQQYDYIVCADVLEHLKQPERTLQECRALLAPHGQLLVSIPNASYSGLLIELMQGEWQYRTEGLLDRTHLRFFTRVSLLRFLKEQHWQVQSLEVIERNLDDSEFQRTQVDTLPPAVLRYLMAQPDALTYQFIFAAEPVEQGSQDLSSHWLPTKTEAAHATFTTNLYWAESSAFREDQKLISRGEIGRSHQALVFEIPSFHAEVPTLRWDPSNRPGFLHLHHVYLKNAHGELLWAWDAQRDMRTATCSQISWQPAPATAVGTTLLLLDGGDPWIQLPIPATTLKSCLSAGNATVEIAVSWPMSADYALLAETAADLKAELQCGDQEILRSRDALHEQRQRAEQLHNICSQQSEKIHALHLDIASLSGQLQVIHQSTAYNVARKISTVKNKLLPSTHTAKKTTEPHQTPASSEPASALSPAPLHTEAELSTDSSQALPQTAPLDHVPSSLASSVESGAPASCIDIIIPIYRGLVDTQRCIESVLKQAHHIQAKCQIILINDASPEPALSAWLREFTAQNPHIILIENDSNLGFVGSVNKGMALNPTHDVLLLNSDTEVANNWLDRLKAIAYQHPNTGSVTPLSNNATICSYPKFCESNDLPTGLDTSELDEICATVNSAQSVSIPTGVGFCMYIRRDCLTDVGYFDEQRFGKGYGEENDFCMRALNAGWQHMLALDTFVRHSGGVSFGDSKTQREQAAYSILQQLHPTYDALIQQHLSDNPAQAARHKIDKKRLQDSVQPKVLMVLHNAGGGTQRHVHELANHLQAQAIFLALIPLPEHRIRLEWLDSKEGYAEEFHWGRQSAQLIDLLRELNIQHIHFHHLLGLDPQILHLPAQLGITYDFTAHDYYTACPQISLTTDQHSYCGELGIKQCTQCLQQRPAPTQENIESWRLRHRLFLVQARNVFAPSEDCARRMKHYFPAASIRYLPHLDIPQPADLPTPRGYPISPRANLRVFVLGGVSANKGGNILEAVALAAARSKAPLEFHLVGFPHRQMPSQPAASLTIHGPYQDEELPLLLERLQPDVVWFPALWPETYSYTLSACLQAGLPVIAPDIGAFTERLSERPWTWLYPWNTAPEAWIQILANIRKDNFILDSPPQPAPATPYPRFAPEGERWNYARDYLRGLAPVAAKGPSPASGN
ncbi:MAG: methyltransferase domain-containing protein [Comamonas sp.]|jgi:GT2 family glycosyltransferase/2-polyprenyl-3-methyl-5-hydroxy-6-metoxy-1,4-benzoquinol methylase/glycosyltransferase involved in cell wall biosynthesis|uniref:methyltransferase domain-containing protein n=1 Tax=Comamonas sp. TaxID=34028 RepID=UPI002FC92976